MTWNERLIPYPVLTPINDDYISPHFELIVSEPVRTAGTLNIPYHLKLSSETLRELITKSRAQYVIQTSCVKTIARDTLVTNEPKGCLELPDGDYSDVLLLTPYVLATEDIDNFKSDEHATEWRAYHPEGFRIDEAGILAVGNDVEITLSSDSIGSVIDLVAMPQADGAFNVSLDDEHIVISVSAEDKQRIDILRMQSEHDLRHASLFSSIYLSAITQAVSEAFDHEDRRWAQVILKRLEDSGVEADRETVQVQALHYAQTLMEQPLSKHLDAAFAEEPDL